MKWQFFFGNTTCEFINKKWGSLALNRQWQCLLSLGTLVRDEEQVAAALRGTPRPPRWPSLDPLTHTPVSPRVGRVVNSSESHSQYIFSLLLFSTCFLLLLFMYSKRRVSVASGGLPPTGLYSRDHWWTCINNPPRQRGDYILVGLVRAGWWGSGSNVAFEVATK